MQLVNHLTPRQVALISINPKHGRTRIDNVQVGVIVVYVFQQCLPMGMTMDFIQEKMCSAMSIMIFNQLHKRMRLKPEVVHRHIQHFVPVGKIFLDVLQQKRGFAHASTALDADKPVVPIDFVKKITVQVGRNGIDFPIEVPVKVFYRIFFFHFYVFTAAKIQKKLSIVYFFHKKDFQ
jgi:hypothetical protein